MRLSAFAVRSSAVLAMSVLLSACSARVPEEARHISPSNATTIRYELGNAPFGVPWPNDLLCWVDEGQSGPCRPNLPTVTQPPVIAEWISAINATRGWSPLGPIVVPFVRSPDARSGPAIDLSRFLALQEDADWSNDAVYLIDLETGLPHTLDFPSTHGSHFLRAPIALDPADSHREAPSLLVETVDERYDTQTQTFLASRTDNGQPTGLPNYAPEWDADSDGITDVPVLLPGRPCPLPPPANVPDRESLIVLRDRCTADSLVDTYDAGQDTLRLYPRSPLTQGREYAVVVTDRLLDNNDQPIESPFPNAVHPRQYAAFARLMSWLRTPALARYYGTLAEGQTSHVRFLWSFTTSSPRAELVELFQRMEPDLSSAHGTTTSDGARVVLERHHDLDAHCTGGAPRRALTALLRELMGLTPSQEQALADSLNSIGSVVTATFRHAPYFLEGAPSQSGIANRNAAESSIPFWITIPKSAPADSPVRLVIVSPEGGTSHFESLRWAGQWASLGLATLGFARSGSGPTLSPALVSLLEPQFGGFCSTELFQHLYASRNDGTAGSANQSRDVDPNVLVTRDRWRTDAIELASLAHALSSSIEVEYASTPPMELVPAAFVGVGTGAAPAALAATLVSDKLSLVLIDPTTSPERAWRRGATWGAPEAELWRIFGPRISGVPSSELASENTHCASTDVSVRLASRDAPGVGIEIGCMPLQHALGARFLNGATVIATNLSTQSRRCVKMTSRGGFSLGLPAATGDELEIEIFDVPNLLKRLGRDADCDVPADAPAPAFVLGGGSTRDGEQAHVTIPVAGLGLERQSSELLQALDLAAAAFSLAHPAPFVAELSQPRTPTDSKGLLLMVSPGDPVVPPDEGLSLANAARLAPSFPAENLSFFPELASDTTPAELANAMRKSTVAARIQWARLDEGVPRLQRFPPDASSCSANITTDTTLDALCHPTCDADADCISDMACLDGTCQTERPDDEPCSQSLPDVDSLADNRSPFGAIQPVPHFRLARYAGTPNAENLTTLWQPQFRIIGPLVPPTHPDWPLIALSLPLTNPWGGHGIARDDWCHAFRFGNYVPYVIGQFIVSAGTQYAPVTSREKQQCLENPKASPNCDFVHLAK